MVPRVRIGRCPTSAVASVSNGRRWRTSGENSMVRCRVIAPNRTSPFSSRMYARLGIAFRSTSAAGRLRRKFSSGIRLCPPARSLASPP